MIYISNSSIHGVGVFTNTPIAPENVFYTCYLFPILDEYSIPLTSRFRDYLFGEYLALGIATMINHSINPNTEITIIENTLSLKAISYIKENEEITIKYGKSPY